MYDTMAPTYLSDDDTLGGRISLARDAADLSVEQTAAMAGVEPSIWRYWEDDRAVPPMNRLEVLAEVLRVDTEWLMRGCAAGR